MTFLPSSTRVPIAFCLFSSASATASASLCCSSFLASFSRAFLACFVSATDNLELSTSSRSLLFFRSGLLFAELVSSKSLSFLSSVTAETLEGNVWTATGLRLNVSYKYGIVFFSVSTVFGLASSVTTRFITSKQSPLSISRLLHVFTISAIPGKSYLIDSPVNLAFSFLTALK